MFFGTPEAMGFVHKYKYIGHHAYEVFQISI